MKIIDFKSIKIKILIMFLTASIPIVTILIVMSGNLGRNTITNLIDKNLTKDVQLYSDNIGEWLEDRMDAIQVYANYPLIRTMDWKKIKPYLKGALEENLDIYDSFFIADKDGNIHSTSTYAILNIKDRDYFQDVMEGKKTLSNPIVSKETGNQIVVLAVPIKNQDREVIGLIGADVNLIKLNKFIKSMSTDYPGSYSFLVTKDGLIITHPNESLIMNKKIPVIMEKDHDGNLFFPREILSKKKGVRESKIGDYSSLYYFNEIPNTDGWKIIMRIPKEYLSQPVEEAGEKLLWIGITGIIFAFLLGLRMSRRISKPIIQLNDVFMRASEGDLSVQADVLSNDEIGMAAKSFNGMMENIRYMTYYDPITNLHNQAYFRDRLKISILLSRQNKEKLAVMTLSLDGFKNINDTLGHHVGDELLKEAGKMLKNRLKEDDVIARMGGSQFILLFSDLDQQKNPIRIAKEILERSKDPWFINGNEFYITSSIGIAFYPHDGEDEHTLLSNADAAMHRAKERGGDHYQLYTQSMNEKLMEQLSLGKMLRQGLENQEFLVYYQPKVDTYTGSIVGMEALVRWKHPDLGMISPAKFIPLAEENGLILPLGDWILSTACMQNKLWQDAGYEPIPVAVNISGRQFIQPNFVKMVADVLQETGLDPEYLEIEITETIAVENTAHTIDVLNKLKKMNIKIAMDDFGTGYSSLSYLKRFAMDHLKIDQSFVRDITSDGNDRAIATAIIAMGRSLDLKVIAEGVETKEQLDFLKKQSCDYIQGYLFSPPLSAMEFEKLLNNNKEKFKKEVLS